MKKIELTIATISIGLTFLFAALFGFAGSAIIGTFWGWFWITTLILVIGFAVANSYFIRKDSQIRDVVEVEALKQLSKFSIKLECAYCQQANITQLLINQRNTFKCDGCNQVNGVSMQFMATALTSPVESVKIPLENTESVEFKVS